MRTSFFLIAVGVALLASCGSNGILSVQPNPVNLSGRESARVTVEVLAVISVQSVRLEGVNDDGKADPPVAASFEFRTDTDTPSWHVWIPGTLSNYNSVDITMIDDETNKYGPYRVGISREL